MCSGAFGLAACRQLDEGQAARAAKQQLTESSVPTLTGGAMSAKLPITNRVAPQKAPPAAGARGKGIPDDPKMQDTTRPACNEVIQGWFHCCEVSPGPEQPV